VRYSVYSNWFRDAQSLRAWLFDFLPSHVVSLNPAKFRSDVLASSEPWIIDFYAPWCGHCQVFAPEFEQVAQVCPTDKWCVIVNCLLFFRILFLVVYVITQAEFLSRSGFLSKPTANVFFSSDEEANFGTCFCSESLM